MDATTACSAGPRSTESPEAATPAALALESGRRVEVVPDLKPAPRIVDKSFRPLDSSPLASGACPLCGGSMGTCSRAHIVGRGQRGDDVPENAAWICGDGVRGCHGVLTHRNLGDHGLTYDEVAPALVRYCRETVPELGAYADRKKYPGWLEDNYLGALEATA